jgi:hypothetical protein
MDIVDCILADHNRQRTLFAALDEARGDGQALGKIFGHLKNFLEAHAEAEERFFYPTLLKRGEGALDSDSAAETTEDAIDDHNKIAEAAEEALRHAPGSDAWWAAVDKCNYHNSHHMSEEERQGLTDFRRTVPREERVRLAIQYLAFEAKHAGEYQRTEKDPDAYIEQHEPA